MAKKNEEVKTVVWVFWILLAIIGVSMLFAGIQGSIQGNNIATCVMLIVVGIILLFIGLVMVLGRANIITNDIEMPNNHILFDKLGKSIFFRNTKTNIVTKKDISSISFMQNMGKVYNIYDLYKEIYKDEFAGNNILDLDFPSSNSSSNTFKEDTYNG